jgi:hypothetical protein
MWLNGLLELQAYGTRCGCGYDFETGTLARLVTSLMRAAAEEKSLAALLLALVLIGGAISAWIGKETLSYADSGTAVIVLDSEMSTGQ